VKCMFACPAPFAVMAQAPFSLADLERIALERNPAVAQGRAAIEVAAARAKQAALYPNPVVSAVGDEIAAGPIIRGGELGVGVQQRIVTAGKLALSRREAEQERLIAEESAKIDRQRLLNTVRRLYYAERWKDEAQIDVQPCMRRQSGRSPLDRPLREVAGIFGESVPVLNN
jgi:outer membrane protein TolC